MAAILQGDAAAKASIRAVGLRFTSALTVAETNRAVIRARLSGRITDQQERSAMVTLQRFTRRYHIVTVTNVILAQAGRRFPVEPVRTLNAIHPATASALDEAPALVTIPAILPLLLPPSSPPPALTPALLPPESTAPDGVLLDVCASTGKLPTLRDYYDRPALYARDPRGGAMGLLFATELMTR